MDVGAQDGHTIINIEYLTPPREHRESGIELLRGGHYRAARGELAEAIATTPGDLDAHYYLALALLGGSRPNRCARADLERVRRHLRTAAPLPEARVLLVLVDEDYGLCWRRHTRIPQALIDLVAQVDRERAGELLVHVPAEGTRTRRVLETVVAGHEPDRG